MSMEKKKSQGQNKASEKVARCLAQGVAETYTLLLKTHFYHWNVTGPEFHSLHVLFEEQYNELFKAVDEIAERLRVLDYTAPGTFAEFSKLSSIKEDKALPQGWEAMVANLVEAHETLEENLKEWIDAAEEAEDVVTADMLTARLQAHGKAAWMLRAHLE